MAAGLSLRVYLKLVDAVARVLRDGKRRLDASTKVIFERLGFDADAVAFRVLAMARGKARTQPAVAG